MSDNKKCLILGAGFGGLCTGSLLLKKVPEGALEIQVVDQNDAMVAGVTHQYITTNRMASDKAPVPFADAKVSVMSNTTVTKIDAKGKSVTVKANGSEKKLWFDYLVVSLGIAPTPSMVPAGFADFAPDIASFGHVDRIKEKIQSIKEGDTVALVVTAVPYKCPPAPYEMMMLVDDHCKRKGIRNKVDMIVYHPEEKGMVPVVKLMTEKHDIKFCGSHKLSGFKDGELKFSNGSTSRVDVCFALYPQMPPAVLKESGFPTNPLGMVKSDVYTLEVPDMPDVFCMGDCAGLMVPDEPPRPHPKAGQFAYHHAECVSDLIAARITGNKSEARQAGKGECFLETSLDKAVMISNDTGLISGKPSVSLSEPTAENAQKKVDWINKYLDMWFNGNHAIKIDH